MNIRSIIKLKLLICVVVIGSICCANGQKKRYLYSRVSLKQASQQWKQLQSHAQIWHKDATLHLVVYNPWVNLYVNPVIALQLDLNSGIVTSEGGIEYDAVLKHDIWSKNCKVIIWGDLGGVGSCRFRVVHCDSVKEYECSEGVKIKKRVSHD